VRLAQNTLPETQRAGQWPHAHLDEECSLGKVEHGGSTIEGHLHLLELPEVAFELLRRGAAAAAVSGATSIDSRRARTRHATVRCGQIDSARGSASSGGAGTCAMSMFQLSARSRMGSRRCLKRHSTTSSPSTAPLSAAPPTAAAAAAPSPLPPPPSAAAGFPRAPRRALSPAIVGGF